jgi:hypothetical protein
LIQIRIVTSHMKQLEIENAQIPIVSLRSVLPLLYLLGQESQHSSQHAF